MKGLFCVYGENGNGRDGNRERGEMKEKERMMLMGVFFLVLGKKLRLFDFSLEFIGA